MSTVLLRFRKYLFFQDLDFQRNGLLNHRRGIKSQKTTKKVCFVRALWS